jgi:NAD(P)-dependent dehydrogenase (short-subunit alcohol dehydrogenase family)
LGKGVDTQQTRDSIPELRKTKGRVIFVSSGTAVNGTFSWGAYGAAKAAMNVFNKTLALEEPDITGVAIRPGVVGKWNQLDMMTDEVLVLMLGVDTQMQFEIRNTHKDTMGKSNERFQELYRTGKILRPEQPGYVIAKLALRADKSLSGQYLKYVNDTPLPSDVCMTTLTDLTVGIQKT